jgi:hypothetical protein
MMITRYRSLALVLAAVTLLAAAPSAALGLTSYYGSNYSYDYNYRTAMAACDMETDGDGAYAKFVVNGSGSTLRLDDPNGSEAGCGYSSGWTNGIYSHQTCEDLAWQPDPCGNKVYP